MKERFIKKTLVEEFESADGEKIAIIKDNNNKVELLEVDNNNEPILSDQQQATLENEARDFDTDNTVARHNMAVEREQQNANRKLEPSDNKDTKNEVKESNS